MYRQGDVLILDPVPLPIGSVKRESNVVAQGEATGHAHRIAGGKVWENDGDLFLVAEDDASLVHEEHKQLSLPRTVAGSAYPVIIQREYDDAHEWRQVVD